MRYSEGHWHWAIQKTRTVGVINLISPLASAVNWKPQASAHATGPCRPSTNSQNDLFGTSGVLVLHLAALLFIFSSTVFALRRNYELCAWKRLSVSWSDFEISETGGRSELVDPGVTMIVAIVTSQRTNRGNAQNSQKWLRRLSQIQRFEADSSNYSSFKWYCI